MAMNLPSQRGRGRRAPMADINVTPLVDVMLVLLIIFMVTAPLLTRSSSTRTRSPRAICRRGWRALPRRARPISRHRCSCAPTARSITAA